MVHKGVALLGFVIYPKFVAIHPTRIKRFKARVCELTRCNDGRSVTQQIVALNRFLRGWIRRRLRMKKMREWKSWKAHHRALRQRGYTGEYQKISMRRWRNSASPLIHMALPKSWFDELGLVDLTTYEVRVLHRCVE